MKETIDSLNKKKEVKLSNNINNKNFQLNSSLALSKINEKINNERKNVSSNLNFRSTSTQSLSQRHVFLKLY